MNSTDQHGSEHSLRPPILRGAAPTDQTMTETQLNACSKKVIGAAIDVHRELGPGLDELDYEEALSLSLTKAGIANERQVPLPIIYKGQKLDCGYRLDILVESALVLELKSVAAHLPIHEAQLLTYLRLSGHELGLLVNFNVVLLKDGILRRVNQLGREPLERRRAVREDAKPSEDLSGRVITAAIEVHCAVGPGLLKSTYAECLQAELSMSGVPHTRRQSVPVFYEGVELGLPFEMEFVIGGALPVMVVSVAEVTPLIEAQFRGKLRLGGWSDGLLMNFNAPTLKDGLRRIGITPRRF
jgi:GxxExxY protein